ncbi:hypothetical protein Hmuk_0973 [Halomicrobium mukohataei DSM 12286]|uniref:Uncharacterized protein n=1 Tax=Halomicrobium mukohataei (strain ATCC 700874 / DSM 12286 / JCM 9738 / NCIMB 13541) TaxID=485914 RepID=C7P194_HALMD|nr:hypothetical protein Hmuk_0973 [Halomicrobium mukohataei DSM 12286]
MLVAHVAAIFEHGPDSYADRQVVVWMTKPEGRFGCVEAIETAKCRSSGWHPL